MDQDPVLLPHRQRPPVHQRARGPRRAGALERRRGRLGALGQEGSGQAHARHRGVAGEVRAPARLPRPARAAQRHGRARHRPGDAVPHVVRAPGAGAQRRGGDGAGPGLQRLGARLLRGRPAAPVSLRRAAPAERRGVDRRAQARGRARLQGGGRAPLLLERPLSDLARVRSALARVRGHRRGARHAHLSLARGADARLGPAHGPGARPLGAGASVHRRGRRLLARPVRLEHHRGHGSGHRRLRDAGLPDGGDDLGDGGGADGLAREVSRGSRRRCSSRTPRGCR